MLRRSGPAARTLLALALSACTVSLDVDPRARVRCTSDAECPQDLTCLTSLNVCVRNADELPKVAVALSIPRQDDVDVSLTPTIVVAFTMDVTAPTSAQVHLASDDHAPSITVSATDLGNTFLVQPNERLLPLTRYTLTIDGGIKPADGVIALVSDAAWTTAFTTTLATDVTPTGPVASFIVERDLATSDAPHALTWVPPDDEDYIGTLVLRGDAPITQRPADGRSYAVGQAIGDTEVVYVGIADTTVDTPSGVGPFYYAAFAFDGALNYSAPTRPPIASVATRLWCPDATGAISVASTDDGAWQLQVSTTANAAFGAGTLYPDAALPLDEGHAFAANAVLSVGDKLHLRLVATNERGTYVGPSFEWWLSSAELAVQVHPFVELTTNAVATLARQAWATIEAEIDTDPAVGADTFAPATVSGAELRALMTTRGVYRFRARPVVEGCADAAWSLSNEFTAGGVEFLYVKEGGAGTQDGFSPGNAAPTIGGVLTAASIGTVVRVSEGTYDSLTLKAGVIFEGGYAPTFSSRDPATYVSHIRGVTNPAVTASVSQIATDTLVDGFTLSRSEPGVANDVIVDIKGGASPTLSRNVVLGHHVAWHSSGISIGGSQSAPVIVDNVIDASIGVWVTDGTVHIEGNVITGDSNQRGAVSCEAGNVTLTNNTIARAVGETSSVGGTAVQVQAYCNATITHNRIRGLVDPNTPNAQTSGIQVYGGSALIANNEIHGGRGLRTLGIDVEPTLGPMSGHSADLVVVNNTIHVDTTAATQLWNQGGASMFFHADTNRPLTYDVRVANNLFLGAGVWLPILFHTGFNQLTVLENNVAVRPTDLFLWSEGSLEPTPFALGESTLCSATVVAANNTYVDVDPETLFTDYGGDDGDPSTLDDNDWSLTQSAPSVIAAGGLTLGAADNCGGASCASLSPPTRSCGTITTDFTGAPRAAPYAVGAHE